MHTLSSYRRRQLGAQLRHGSARIVGQTCEGASWPEGTHYWIIEDLVRQRTEHVPTAQRPSWIRYATD